MMLILFLAAPSVAASTQVTVVKFANDGTTTNQRTLDYIWMKNTFPFSGME